MLLVDSTPPGIARTLLAGATVQGGEGHGESEISKQIENNTLTSSKLGE
jgi:hypothetical protein